jgi:hypothetical protein
MTIPTIIPALLGATAPGTTTSGAAWTATGEFVTFSVVCGACDNTPPLILATESDALTGLLF